MLCFGEDNFYLITQIVMRKGKENFGNEVSYLVINE